MSWCQVALFKHYNDQHKLENSTSSNKNLLVPRLLWWLCVINKVSVFKGPCGYPSVEICLQYFLCKHVSMCYNVGVLFTLVMFPILAHNYVKTTVFNKLHVFEALIQTYLMNLRESFLMLTRLFNVFVGSFAWGAGYGNWKIKHVKSQHR